MSNKNKHDFIEFLNKNPKTSTWRDLAIQFNLPSGEAARKIWAVAKEKKSKTHSIMETPTEQIIEVESEQQIKTLDELIQKTNIDLNVFKIVKWVQNFWNNMYQVKVWLAPISKTEDFTNKFISFLSTYHPTSPIIVPPTTTRLIQSASLIINRQDAHYNKQDIGNNNWLQLHFLNIENAIISHLDKALLTNNLDVIYYVIGSDQFNSEWTLATTKGTPQQNNDSYHNSFNDICEHEVKIITTMLKKAHNVHILYVPGNHDEYVGWHLIKWLTAYFRNDPRLSFDITPNYRKYVKYNSNGIMFNHGDAIKPEKLASLFPIEFKKHWSDCENYYIFTGDKHHQFSKDINGIQFFQLPACSDAVSKWDDKNGYVTSKAELVSFVINKYTGLTDTYRTIV